MYQRNKQQVVQIDREIAAKTKENFLTEKQVTSLRAGIENWNNIKENVEQIRQCITKIRDSDRKVQGLRKNFNDFLRENPGIDRETLIQADVPDIQHLIQQSENTNRQLERSNKTTKDLETKLENMSNKKTALEDQLRNIQTGSDKFTHKENELQSLEKEIQETNAKITSKTQELVHLRQKERDFAQGKDLLQRKKAQFDADHLELRTKAASSLQELQKYTDLWSNNQNKSRRRQELDTQKDT